MQHILEEYRKRKREIRKRLDEFAKVKGDKVFYELCFCICTPQSNARKCDQAVRKLMEKDFLRKDVDPEKYLRGYVRFHRNKSGYLLEAKSGYRRIMKAIKGKTPHAAREWIAAGIKGLSYKEASHFLRNIGKRDLAILDRHIVRNLRKYRAVSKDLKFPLSGKMYLETESRFREFSKKLGIPMDELDLLFWSMETGVVFK